MTKTAAIAALALLAASCASVGGDASRIREARESYAAYQAALEEQRALFARASATRRLPASEAEAAARRIQTAEERFADAFAAAQDADWSAPSDKEVADVGFSAAGMRARARGDHAAAARALDRALDRKFVAELVPVLVRETALAGDFDGAAARARAFAGEMKPEFVVTVMDALGDVEALRGDEAAALEAYRRAAAGPVG